MCVNHAGTRHLEGNTGTRGAFQYQKISLPKMSFGLVQSGWGESECFCKNLAPGSCEVFKDIFRAYRNAPQEVWGFNSIFEPEQSRGGSRIFEKGGSIIGLQAKRGGGQEGVQL